jgi:hypothetical protein
MTKTRPSFETLIIKLDKENSKDVHVLDFGNSLEGWLG